MDRRSRRIPRFRRSPCWPGQILIGILQSLAWANAGQGKTCRLQLRQLEYVHARSAPRSRDSTRVGGWLCRKETAEDWTPDGCHTIVQVDGLNRTAVSAREFGHKPHGGFCRHISCRIDAGERLSTPKNAIVGAGIRKSASTGRTSVELFVTLCVAVPDASRAFCGSESLKKNPLTPTPKNPAASPAEEANAFVWVVGNWGRVSPPEHQDFRPCNAAGRENPAIKGARPRRALCVEAAKCCDFHIGKKDKARRRRARRQHSDEQQTCPGYAIVHISFLSHTRCVIPAIEMKADISSSFFVAFRSRGHFGVGLRSGPYMVT